MTQELGVKGFEWCNPGVDDIYLLLRYNYISHDFVSLLYPKETLRWELSTPFCDKKYIIGVRVTQTKKLVGCITALLYDGIASINFLCVHKKVRDKKLAGLLIKSLVNVLPKDVNISFTSATLQNNYIKYHVSTRRYYHYPLNHKKLRECGFCDTKTKVRKLKTDKKCMLLTANDSEMLETFIKLTLVPKHIKDYPQHYFLSPQSKQIVFSFVYKKDGKITDLVSFYTLYSEVNGCTIKCAYAFVTLTKDKSLVKSMLAFAKKSEYDVFTCFDDAIFLDVGALAGTGYLNYYFIPK